MDFEQAEFWQLCTGPKDGAILQLLKEKLTRGNGQFRTSDKSCTEPALSVITLAPPPVAISRVCHSNHISPGFIKIQKFTDKIMFSKKTRNSAKI